MILLGATAVQTASNCAVLPGETLIAVVSVKAELPAPIFKRMTTARTAGEKSWTQ
jgi:hypothetical protein